MIAVAVVRKHMFANDKQHMLFGILLFSTHQEAIRWIKHNPVDEYTGQGNRYQYEMYRPRFVGEA